ncbi:acyltransferase family protein [Ruminococcus sp.]|uniref:acyltransferase family protein n=1 Tax=Ruminococcus sp. TaxID=41978 RepID=UPI00389059AC
MNRRIHYIDNLRWMTVSLLILFHAAIAYNTWGEANYIFFEPIKPIASVVTFITPWFMPLMFLLAGVSSRYSLQKRGTAAFIRERLIRLGIPLVFGIIVLNPILSFIADKCHNAYAGGYFEHYGVYFTRITDLTGYDGGFTVGHLWFLLILMVISLLSCVIIKLIPKCKTATRITGILLSVSAVATFDIKFFSKPLIMFLCVYLLGYYVFADRDFVARLSRLKWILVTLFLLSSVADVVLYIYIDGFEILNTVCYYMTFITGIPAIIAIGYDHLDFSNRITKFNASISYVFYIIHFPIVVMCQYCMSLIGVNAVVNFFLTIIISYMLTVGLCVVIKKTKLLQKCHHAVT